MYRNIEDPRSVQSKSLLYRALALKMREKPFPTITIKEVVQSAQVGRSTFYRNFDRLEDILLWKCDETFHDICRAILQSLPPEAARAGSDRFASDRAGSDRTGSEKFPFILPFFRYWADDSEIVELLIAANRIDILLTAFEESLKKLIMQVRPELINGSPLFGYFLAFRTGAVIRVLLKWINNRKDLTPEELYNFIESQSKGLGRSDPPRPTP